MKFSLTLIFIILSITFTFTASSATISSCKDDECINYFNKFKVLSRKGHTDAMVMLGEFYYNGYGTDKDIKKALRQYRIAARYGSVRGQAKAGLLYLTLPGFKDNDEGIKYLKQAARNRHSHSAYLLGVIYDSKEFGYYDVSESDKWLAKAYKYGHLKAMTLISLISNSENFSSHQYPRLSAIIEELASENDISIQETKILLSDKKYQERDSDNKINSPKNELEVITVLAPSLPEVLNMTVASLKGHYPEKYNRGTGSRIIGQTCAKQAFCYTVGKEAYRQMRYNANK